MMGTGRSGGTDGEGFKNCLYQERSSRSLLTIMGRRRRCRDTGRYTSDKREGIQDSSRHRGTMKERARTEKREQRWNAEDGGS